MRILDTFDDALIAQLRETHEFFWLDATGLTAEQIKHLGTLLDLHPLAIEDSVKFGQRPKLDAYGDTALLVLEGGVASRPEDENPHPLEEIHCHLSGDFIVTLHRNPFPELQTLRTLFEHHTTKRSEQYHVYKIVDVIVDSFFPILADLDEEINDLEDAIVSGAGRRELAETFRLKRLLLVLRKAVVPMRDVFAREIEVIADLAGLESDSHDYFRDVYDHLIRITDELDSYHEMVAGCTDLYLSTVANRQGETSKQLAIIASIFLPLSFLTGFFGMNFTWEIANILVGPWAFFALGIGTMAVAAGSMWLFFRRKGWTGNDA
ncbi:magnesium transporter CorA family protein [Microbacterium sp. ASV49]|uniref:Magnesium transporter CorA family protein n=1 Tax=Microbacterium candidum TaxID=3041922 RepID=A0ABT7N259_9MICO|nr:magnesium transporter CorA family protein [Microbacterium sp. ASV49]MDL9980756.1 magnesium transporter CorA family protein [Microbacterium sp. ASV49]